MIAAIGGIAYYTWHQVTQLPTEYVEALAKVKGEVKSSPQSLAQIQQQAAASKQKIINQVQRSAAGKKVEVEISDRDLNYLVLAKIRGTNQTQPVPAGVKVVNTKIKDGKLHAGAVVNLGELAQDQKSSESVAILDRLTDKLPFLKDRDIYVGIEGKPIVEDGKIKFNRDTQVKVGNMSLTIAQLAENLGVSEAKIEQLMNLKLAQPGLRIDRINLEQDQIKIEGKRN